MALNPKHRIWLFGICFMTVVFPAASENTTCSPGVRTKGYTIPHGDIVIEYGNPLEILCILDDEAVAQDGPNASNKLFFSKGNVRLPSEMVQIVNSTTIRLYIEKPPQGPYVNYECSLQSEGQTRIVCMNLVFVGHKPEPVTDFKCIGYNYENLTCTWTEPENFVHTKYTLNYSLRGRSPRYFNCPQIEKVENSKKLRCVWSIFTNPLYRQVHRQYTFYLTAENEFGEWHFNESFVHFANVLSGPPENLKAIDKTTNSIVLSWKVPSKMEGFPPGLHHRVLYQCEHNEKKWQLAAMITNKTKVNTIKYELTGIEHPHILCDIRVSLRSADARYNDEFMWSKNASITVRTRSTVPAEPPGTDVGSFEVVVLGSDIQNREVYIYWKQIPEEKRNGPDFRYEVTILEDSSKKPIEIGNSYAKFVNLSIGESYTFYVWSSNANGTSVEKSIVRVPRQTERVSEPLSFTKVEYKDGIYELTWKRPKLRQGEELSNYTLFWCSNERDRPYQCTGKLDWVIVSPDETFHNVSLPENRIYYQFAISANTHASSSGMSWATCTVIHKSIGKIKDVWINRIGPSFMEVGWKLECASKVGSIDGYTITYCPLKQPNMTLCKVDPKTHKVPGDSSVVQARITDLTPYTTYMLTISAVTRHAEFSQASDPILNTTSEAAPSSPPMNFEYVGVTNSSVSLKWQAPSAMNGMLKYYTIRYNEQYMNIDQDKDHPTYEYTLKNLESYKNYSISICACTIECSSFSEPLHVTTLTGYPGKIDQPGASFQNSSIILISWKPPSPRRGKTDLYEVQIKQKHKDTNITLPIFNVTGESYIIEDCGEDGEYNSFYITVRAINLIPGMHLKGPWSETFEFYCQTSQGFVIYIIIFSTFILALIIVYLFKKLYSRCLIMRDVEVKLPPGLAPVVTSDHTLVPWSSGKLTDDQDYSPADQEMLLAKISEGKHLSGDSSGCSSGLESATSSLQSGSHLSSASDSGTEQRSPSSDDRKNSLRLRNVPSTRPVTTSKGYVVMPPDTVTSAGYNVMGPPPGNYCVLGVDPGSSISEESPYVLPDESSKVSYIPYEAGLQTTPYVVSGELIKSVNPGYVPYIEPTETSHPYVVAGTKNMLLPDLMGCESLGGITLASQDKPQYVQVADMKNLEVPWQKPTLETCNLVKVGYVTVGDSMAQAIQQIPRSCADHKGYVQHMPFEVKSLKED